MKCYKCGASIDAKTNICPQCGASQEITEGMVRKGIERDEAALSHIYNKSYQKVWHTILFLIDDEEKSEELIQDSYVFAFKNLDKVDNPANIILWLCKIARKKTLEFLEKNPEYDTRGKSSDDFVECRIGASGDAYDVTLSEQTPVDVFKQALRSLTQDEFMFTEDFYSEGKSISEISDSYGVTESYVVTELKHAREIIKKKLIEAKLYSVDDEKDEISISLPRDTSREDVFVAYEAAKDFNQKNDRKTVLYVSSEKDSQLVDEVVNVEKAVRESEKHCEICGFLLDDQFKFCPICGQPVLKKEEKPASDKHKIFSNLDMLLKKDEETFADKLFFYIDQSGKKDTEVYKAAHISKAVFSSIRSKWEKYKPSKETALALAIALQLSLPDTEDLLARAGLRLSDTSKFDIIVSFCIEHEIFNLFDVNEYLDHYEQPVFSMAS